MTAKQCDQIDFANTAQIRYISWKLYNCAIVQVLSKGIMYYKNMAKIVKNAQSGHSATKNSFVHFRHRLVPSRDP